MELVIFCGIPAAGKSSFYRERFFDTHVRVNLDMLKTRHRERLIFEACLEARQPVVIDNTNPAAADRAGYIAAARARGFAVLGYYFRSVIAESLERNARREGSKRVPDRAVMGAAGRLEIPRPEEGFDRLFYVRLEDGFVVEPWSA